MIETPALRRLLVVDPCDDCYRLLPGLRSVGWDVDSCSLENAADRTCDVGLLRLQPFHLERPEAVKELISRSGTEWIAVLNQEVLRLQNVGDFVCEWFFDFHTLPFDVSRVQVTLGRAFGMARLRGQGTIHIDQPEHELLGDSKPIRELRKLLSKLAPTESPVLIRGESGTGKELVARTLHRQSQRHNKPFVAINCGAIPEHLIQSELFGHEKGAFTGAHQRKVGRIEAANGGTLFLDEIGDLPLELQANLLRFLQEKHIEHVGGSQPIPVDVRVLAATHVDLEAAVEKKTFREDLYYRLNVLQVVTAPLRERHGDLSMLANHFSHFYSHETGRRPRSFSDDALIAMGKHDWPGNVRELANRVRRGLVLAEGRQIEARDLGLISQHVIPAPMGTLEDYKTRAERQALCDVLNRHSDNLSIAAKVLGISRPTFYRLLHKHQIR
ncbi:MULTISPECIES: sigma-54 dependent transcriptional regulator [Pseudomonas]|jgi:DNA-binding NtrC family response regulator|uniref:DNA-binding transcriptional response regulator, NtrC family, contains REC, AAA-type ATPase, and a Fis-type DNA-binding domains n=2 Tax=Pseudomonas fluorescens group TaxID=136843 RepID=A0AB36D067_9PSED|nr:MULTISPECIES: sigma-54 dependent transcriptional regulator [Pseudomonas]MBU0522587.1 sigma-54 dependent transcriptional regulator [Gammaproteobacteria bacterium]MDF9880892.1 DNA-binding NtrC family response regulator [Pseudomonas silensiensis]MBU0821994.1 sigma-54 dependent transcriptional regulator [Gammaproteobacteria bacterium]MBU0844107.1 sigma-54 dependent transcriptional regulator [Gammaproteobacteria bacterium]MBU1842358.1 sigma-54 dependent transcriptional regulator [Gammaproteobact